MTEGINNSLVPGGASLPHGQKRKEHPITEAYLQEMSKRYYRELPLHPPSSLRGRVTLSSSDHPFKALLERAGQIKDASSEGDVLSVLKEIEVALKSPNLEERFQLELLKEKGLCLFWKQEIAEDENSKAEREEAVCIIEKALKFGFGEAHASLKQEISESLIFVVTESLNKINFDELSQDEESLLQERLHRILELPGITDNERVDIYYALISLSETDDEIIYFYRKILAVRLSKGDEEARLEVYRELSEALFERAVYGFESGDRSEEESERDCRDVLGFSREVDHSDLPADFYVKVVHAMHCYRQNDAAEGHINIESKAAKISDC